jgi:hypothetical protein
MGYGYWFWALSKILEVLTEVLVREDYSPDGDAWSRELSNIVEIIETLLTIT